MRSVGRRRKASIAATVGVALAIGMAGASSAGAYVYWANTGPSFDGSTIGRANLDATSVNQSFITGANGPCGVAVNATHIYWGNSGLGAGVPDAGTIGRANLNGTGANQNLVTQPDNPCGVALDGTHVYWTDADQAMIGRANLNGSAPDPDFIGPLGACGVAVDAVHIYWGDQSGAIGRANLNGTGVDRSFITGADQPCGVAVNGSHIYWANSGASGDGPTLGRANLNGTGVDQSFISGAHGACGVAVNGNAIFWGNFATDTIGRARIDGSVVRQSFITGANAPCGVALDSGRTKAAVKLTTQASAGIVVGQGVTDTAKLSGGVAPSGRITFRLFGRGDASCSRTPAFAGSVPVSGNGSYTSPRFVPKRAGIYRFVAIYSGDTRNRRVVSPCNAPGESVTVRRTVPQLTTHASLVGGNRIRDVATLTGGRSPTGMLNFHVFRPGDTNCSKGQVIGDSVPVSGNGDYRSRRFAPRRPGKYRFTVTYRGDVRNRTVTSPCNAPGESVIVPRP